MKLCERTSIVCRTNIDFSLILIPEFRVLERYFLLKSSIFEVGISGEMSKFRREM